MENTKNNKVLIVTIVTIIVILLILGLLFVTKTANLKTNNVDTNNEDNLELDNSNNDNLNNENQEKIQETNEYKKIILSNENETFDIEKLHLDFKGVTTEDGKEYFKYTLDIKYDDKNINSTFFNDKNNYKIWSNNMAADFKIYKIEDVYILVSFIAKQCFCDEIMIFNTDGDILKTFTIAEFGLNNSNIVIKTSDNGECMGTDWEKHVTEYKFKITGSKLIEQ